MWRFALMALLAAGPAFGQTTKPTTAPSTQPDEKRAAIEAAIKRGDLAIGMTVDEAVKAMGKAGERTQETASDVTYEWKRRKTVKTGERNAGGVAVTKTTTFYLAGTFRRGTLIQIDKY
jgi:hypothetical protein